LEELLLFIRGAKRRCAEARQEHVSPRDT